MKGIKLNDSIRHIFKEAILDFKMGASRGNQSAIFHHSKFNHFLKLGEVPVSDLGYLYDFYKKQEKDLEGQEDPRLAGLKSEVKYMINYMGSMYKITDDGNAVIMEAKE